MKAVMREYDNLRGNCDKMSHKKRVYHTLIHPLMKSTSYGFSTASRCWLATRACFNFS